MNKLQKAFNAYTNDRILIGGGVSANSRLKLMMQDWAKTSQVECFYPEKAYCTDNAAMVAFIGLHYFLKNPTSGYSHISCTPNHLEKDFFSIPSR